MKNNLKNCSIIIPFRSSDLREKILFKILDFLNKNFDTEILLAEHDYEKKLNSNEIEKKYNLKYFFIKSKKEELFDRTGTLNFLIKKASGKIIFNHDSDCIIDPSCYIFSKKIIEKRKYDVVIPYSGKGYNVSHEFNIKEKKEKDIMYLRWKRARGGIVAIDKSKYIKAGMENPNIISWGFEDYERLIRFDKLGYKICANDLHGNISYSKEKFFENKHLYHFDHDSERNENSSKNPYYENNKKISEKINMMSALELEKEIVKWKKSN